MHRFRLNLVLFIFERKQKKIHLIIAVYLAGCCSDCIGAVGYKVTGKFQIIVSISISSGACQLLPSSIPESLSIPKLLCVVTNSKCKRHRTSTIREFEKKKQQKLITSKKF